MLESLDNKRIYISILLIIILVIGTGIFFATKNNPDSSNQLNQILFSSGTIKATDIGGFNILSLSLIDMSSQSAYLRGEKVWAMTVSGGGILGQTGLMRINQTNAPVSGKEKPLHDFSIEIKSITQSCEFPIVKDTYANPVYKLTTPEWAKNVLHDCNYNAPACNNWIWGPTQILKFNLPYCGGVCAQTRAIPADLASAQVRTKITTGLYSGTEHYEAILDSAGRDGQTVSGTYATFGPSSNPLGAVVWSGGTVTGAPCSYLNPSTQKALYLQEGVSLPEWRTYSYTAWSSYNQKMNQYIGNSYTGTQWGSVVADVNNINMFSDTLIASQTNFGTITEKTSSTGGKVVLTSSQGLISQPLLTYYLKASWIGFYTPAPEAKIVSATSSCFKPGDVNANIKVVIQNIGTEQGNFEINANCGLPFSTPTVAQTIGLASQETTTVYIPITAQGVNVKVNAKCTVNVYNPVSGNKQKIADVCVDPIINCQASNRWCVGTQIWECNSFGTANNFVSDCAPKKCVQEGLGARCSSDQSCNANNICESARGETEKNCVDCKPNYCTSCTDWFTSLFKSEEKSCQSKAVFEKECKWYDIGCHANNLIMPSWTQDQICPWILGVIGVISALFILLIVVIIKKIVERQK